MEHRAPDELLWPPGTDVQVRVQYDDSWASGFEIAATEAEGRSASLAYRIRRVSDNRVLPAVFSVAQLRRSP